MTLNSINYADYDGIDSGYSVRHDGRRNPDTGSHIEMLPALQLANRKEAREVTKVVRGVYKTEQKTGDWKEKAVNAIILIATAVALIALGLLGGHTIGWALGIGIGLAAYGLYQLHKTWEKKSAQEDIEKVHEDATIQRFSEKIQKNQLKRERRGRDQNRGAYVEAPVGRSHRMVPDEGSVFG